MDYNKLYKICRKDELPHYRRGINKKPLMITNNEPFLVNDFLSYFQRNYFSLCQILGEDSKAKMPTSLMYMAMRIHNYEAILKFDFASKIEKKIHEKLVSWKEKKSNDFHHYSLLCYLIRFQNQQVFI